MESTLYKKNQPNRTIQRLPHSRADLSQLMLVLPGFVININTKKNCHKTTSVDHKIFIFEIFSAITKQLLTPKKDQCKTINYS